MGKRHNRMSDLARLPGNTDAEKALLGSFLLSPALFRQVDSLSVDDFVLSSHRVIYRAMATLDAEGQPIDAIVLCDLLRRRKELTTIGGEAYIASLLDSAVPESVNGYASIIKKTAVQRELLNALEGAKSKLCDGEHPETVWSLLTANRTVWLPSTNTLGHTYEELANAPEIGFAINDFLQEDEITLIGGLSGHGKTLIALAMTRALLEGGKLFHRFQARKSDKVIYLIPEAGQKAFAKRLRTFRLLDHVKSGHLLVRTLDKGPIALNDPLLMQHVKQANLFLDTAIRFKKPGTSELDAQENAEFAESLFNLQRAGARTITGLHHAPKGFEQATYITLENVLRGTGDIGAMISTCWAIRQIDFKQNRIWMQNVKARDFEPLDPFIIQGRPSIDETGYFELTEPPGYAGQLADHLPDRQKPGRRAAPDKDQKMLQAKQLNAGGMSVRDIAERLGVSKTAVSRWLSQQGTD